MGAVWWPLGTQLDSGPGQPSAKTPDVRSEETAAGLLLCLAGLSFRCPRLQLQSRSCGPVSMTIMS